MEGGERGSLLLFFPSIPTPTRHAIFEMEIGGDECLLMVAAVLSQLLGDINNKITELISRIRRGVAARERA